MSAFVRYHPGKVKKSEVTKLTNFGVFGEREPALEGLLHIPELSDEQVECPENVLSRPGSRRGKEMSVALALIYRLGESPRLASVGQAIADQPCLRGLKLPVARLFE